MTRPLIVCCSPDYGEGWRNLGRRLTGEAVEWAYFDDRPIHWWERVIRRYNSGTIRACFQAVRRASRGHAKLLITQDPRITSMCALFCRILRVHIDHYVFSFNFPELPTGLRRRLMRYAFRNIGQFSVHSSMERDLYSQYFDIPKDRIYLRLWSIGVPDVSPEYPLQEGRYVSSIGGNGRDYRTLLEAARGLPDIQFVLVVRPESLVGLEVPLNVKVIVNAAFEAAMNIMQHSAFTVLPLLGSTVPAGHVTLVCAMHLGRAIIATDSAGIHDYVRSDHNGLLCQPFSPDSLAQAIARLWSNSDEIARLSRNSRCFGTENCTEDRMRSDLAKVLAHWNIPLCPEAMPVAVLQSDQ
jgi:glycosyltransferase involved in cell wall biosynthesis